jgi:hypothetical protein
MDGGPSDSSGGGGALVVVGEGITMGGVAGSADVVGDVVGLVDVGVAALLVFGRVLWGSLIELTGVKKTGGGPVWMYLHCLKTSSSGYALVRSRKSRPKPSVTVVPSTTTTGAVLIGPV